MNNQPLVHENEARADILSRIRQGKPTPLPHPDVPIFPFPGDTVTNFETNLKNFSGELMRFDSRSDAIDWVRHNLISEGHTVFSSVNELKDFTTTSADYPDPHEANVIDITIGEGIVGVGETGSVFVTDKSLGLPAAALFCTDLYLLLDHNAIVPSIQEAYNILDLRANRYGSFYSGPSVTADIEAVHITGAQAELSLTVLLY